MPHGGTVSTTLPDDQATRPRSGPVVALAFTDPPAELLLFDVARLCLATPRLTLTGEESPDDLADILAGIGLDAPAAAWVAAVQPERYWRVIVQH
jgi:hypothetical protein